MTDQDEGHEPTQLERLAAAMAGYDARPGAAEGQTPAQVVINAVGLLSDIIGPARREQVVHVIGGGQLPQRDIDHLVQWCGEMMSKRRPRAEPGPRLPAGLERVRPT